MKGYFRKRGDKWSFTIDIGLDPVTGKRKQKTVSGFKTKKEAQLAAASMQQKLASGSFTEASETSFKEFAEEWLQFYANKEGIKDSTVRARKYQMYNLFEFFQAIKIKDITRKQYQNMLDELNRRIAKNTLSGIHSTGKMIFERARQLEIISADPTEFAVMPRREIKLEELEEETITEKYMEKNELARFLDITREQGLPGDEAIFTTLSYTGIRIGELCALKWRDIDFENKTISIRRTLNNPNDHKSQYKLETPKTKSPKRTIDVDDKVLNFLEKHKAAQNIVRMRFRNTYHDQDFVFANTERAPGYPMTRRSIERRMERLVLLAGYNRRLTPHALRHTHTSLLAQAGVGLQEIMERLGHKDDAITRNVYLHVTKDMKKTASEKFSNLMSNL